MRLKAKFGFGVQLCAVQNTVDQQIQIWGAEKGRCTAAEVYLSQWGREDSESKAAEHA